MRVVYLEAFFVACIAFWPSLATALSNSQKAPLDELGWALAVGGGVYQAVVALKAFTNTSVARAQGAVVPPPSPPARVTTEVVTPSLATGGEDNPFKRPQVVLRADAPHALTEEEDVGPV